jgi:hypothetical protein
LRWFRRRGIMDQTGSSYSDLVIPRPKVRSLDAESMGSGSSEFTIREEVERRVVTVCLNIVYNFNLIYL